MSQNLKAKESERTQSEIGYAPPAPQPNLRNPSAVSSEIIGYGFWMRKEGYSETTIERYVRLLKELAKRGDLLNSDSVKEALTRTDWSEATKEMACGAYTIFAKQHMLAFVPPRYRRVDKLPFIPLESEVEQLIAAMRLRTSTFLSLLKDTVQDR